jgi:hypothetical protein
MSVISHPLGLELGINLASWSRRKHIGRIGPDPGSSGNAGHPAGSPHALIVQQLEELHDSLGVER